jgi:hypothetical protein
MGGGKGFDQPVRHARCYPSILIVLLFSHENYSQSMLVPCLPPDRAAEADAIGTRGIMLNYGQRGSVSRNGPEPIIDVQERLRANALGS